MTTLTKVLIGFLAISFSISALAEEGESVNKTVLLTLNNVNSSSYCAKYFKDISLKMQVDISKKALSRNGLGQATLINPTSGVPPIQTILDQLGDSDHMAFSKYFKPGKPFKINKHDVSIYGIYVNHCNSLQTQAAVQFNIKGGHTCLFSTQTWNNCRYKAIEPSTK
jgi:hypothetical protein